jgi:hypothetical protein
MTTKKKNIISEEEQRPKKHNFWAKIFLDKDGDLNQFVFWSLFYCLFFFMLLCQYFQFGF